MACAASAAPAPDPLAALIACRELVEEAARLACFDRQIEVLAHAAPAPPLAPEQTFGLPPMAISAMESAKAGRTELAETQARLVGLGFLMDGRIEFTLDNGQVWRQLSHGDELLLKTGDIVRLSRGALHSYWLKTPSGRACKVTRVR
jgi:hypothetical protein